MNKTLRRTLLLILTLITLALVIGGVCFDNIIEDNPSQFALFWGICLILVCLIFIVAISDILAVRKDYKERQKNIDNQLADYIAEAKENHDQQQ